MAIIKNKRERELRKLFGELPLLWIFFSFYPSSCSKSGVMMAMEKRWDWCVWILGKGGILVGGKGWVGDVCRREPRWYLAAIFRAGRSSSEMT